MTFNLSEKIGYWGTDDKFHIDVEPYKIDDDILDVKDVKEFIRLLKEEAEKDTFEWGDESCDGEWHTGYDKDELIRFIDKLAGDKLK
jgi:hypothetical protein